MLSTATNFLKRFVAVDFVMYAYRWCKKESCSENISVAINMPKR